MEKVPPEGAGGRSPGDRSRGGRGVGRGRNRTGGGPSRRPAGPAGSQGRRPDKPPARSAPPEDRRWLSLAPPRRSLALAGWALLPLRAFLGFTFSFAGLQKLANPNFFNANSPSSIQAQLIAAERVSPLHSLLGHFLQFATPIGVLIALGELAVGIGTLVGLWSRAAAIGGLVLSFTLFLTVSFHSSPYYTGADIAFFFAWTPLILAGSGGVLSIDALVASWSRHEQNLGPANLVAVPFSVIQGVCGNYEDDRCRALRRAPCDVARCPFLADERKSLLSRGPDDLDRRQLVLGGMAAVAAGAVSLVVAGAAAAVGRAVGGAPSPSSHSVTLPGGRPGSGTTTTTGPATTTTPPTATGPTTTVPAKPPGTAVGPAKDVPVGGAASFSDPRTGDPSLVLHPVSGSFVAYDAVCPHAGCTVGYARSANLLVCPCHGSQFNPANGNVEIGPAPTGLRRLTVAEGPDGLLYVV